MARSRKRGKEARYERAVRRQIEFTRRLAAHGHGYSPIEQFLRPGDTIKRFMPDSSDATDTHQPTEETP